MVLFFTSSPNLSSRRMDGSEDCTPDVPPSQVAPVSGPGKADIIFIVDTSGSMGTESDLVRNNLNAFGQHLEDEGIDYRLILIGQDRECCKLCVLPPLSSSKCAMNGPKFLQVNEYIGSYDACSRVLTPSIYNQYSAFLRVDAAKTIVFVSDDKTGGSYTCNFDNNVNTPCKLPKANQFLADLQALDSANGFFAAQPKLPKGVMVHSIDGHTCAGEPGNGYSFTYQGLAEVTGGTNFKLCNDDWTSYFSTIAGAVASTTTGSSCEHDIPRSTTDSALLVGNLEPDTPFTLSFKYTSATTQLPITLTFAQSTTNTCVEQGCTYAPDPCVCSARCPINYARDPNDATLCLRSSQPT